MAIILVETTSSSYLKVDGAIEWPMKVSINQPFSVFRTFVMITIAMHYRTELVASSELIEWWQVYHSSSQYRKWES